MELVFAYFYANNKTYKYEVEDKNFTAHFLLVSANGNGAKAH
jgi:hypothetical protein